VRGEDLRGRELNSTKGKTMGRSVSYHSNAAKVVFLHDVLSEGAGNWEWDEFIDDLKGVIRERYPSFEDADRWAGREDHVILENSAAEISVAEYCGLISVSLAPREASDYDYDYDGESIRAWNENWTNLIANNFHDHLAKRFSKSALRKIGSFSNGEGVYELIN